MRRLVFDQSSPVQPVADYWGEGGYPERDGGGGGKGWKKSSCLIWDSLEFTLIKIQIVLTFKSMVGFLIV